MLAWILAVDARRYVIEENSSGRLLQKHERCMNNDQLGQIRFGLHLILDTIKVSDCWIWAMTVHAGREKSTLLP
ncbi:MAG: hypothetical protein P8X93_06605 [Gammaproteobacteria bacterium]